MKNLGQLLSSCGSHDVEWRALGDIGTVTRGKRFVKSDMLDVGVPCMHYGEIYTKYGVAAFESASFVSTERARTLRFAKPGDVILASAGETIEDIGKAVAWLGSDDIAIHDACYAFSSDLNPKFVSYFFASHNFRDQIRQQISSSKISSISTQNVAKARIPVPPTELQQRIVQVLDEFDGLESELEAELKAERDARRRQYVHYRDIVLAFGEEVPRSSLGSLGVIFGGLTGKSKSDFENGNARFASYKNVFNNISLDSAANDFVKVSEGERQRSLARGDIIFTGSSESFDDVGMTSVVTTELTEPLYLNSFCIGFRPHSANVLNPDFAKHLFRSHEMRKQIIKTANGVTRINVSKARLAEIAVPIPDLDTQVGIARVLDRMDAINRGLRASLPEELRMRRKQYEHYRDRLLAFEGATA